MKAYINDFEKIYRENYQSVYSFLHVLTQSTDAAQRLTQNTFVNAYKNILRYKETCSMKIWLLEEACKQFMHFLKTQNQVLDFSLLITDPETPVSEKAEFQWTGKVSTGELDAFLSGLPQRDSLILLLRIFGDADYFELAGLTGISPESAAVIFTRTKERIKEVLFND